MKTQPIKLTTIVILTLAFATQSQIPRQIAYQGILTDPKGNVKPDGKYGLTFSIYDA